jgi:uncharacterized small protein (DUF1192 family)
VTDVRTTAEQLAAQAIRRGLEDGLNLDTRALSRIADTTGLTLAEVSALRDRVVSGKRPTPPQSPPALRPVPPSPAQGWRSAKDHPERGIRDLYGRAVAAVAAVEAALEHWTVTRELREREALLAAELERVRARLGGNEEHPCPDCGRIFNRAQALGTHRTRAHREATA